MSETTVIVEQQDPSAVLENNGWPGSFTLQPGNQEVVFKAFQSTVEVYLDPDAGTTLQIQPSNSEPEVTCDWLGSTETTYVVQGQDPSGTTKLTITGSTGGPGGPPPKGSKQRKR